MTTLEGGCLCGRIRFKAHKPPVRTFACHCTFCQRVTGSAFYAESIFEVDAVEFNGGKRSKYEHVSDNSRKKVVVEFCPTCGTTIGLSFERWPTMRSISRGCYDNPNVVEISSHIWTRSAQTGIVLPALVDCFFEARASLDGQVAHPVRHDTTRQCQPPRARPNPCVEARPNGKAPWPRGVQVYHPPRCQGASPPYPPHLEREASWSVSPCAPLQSKLMPSFVTAYQGRAGDRNNLATPGALALAAQLAQRLRIPLLSLGLPAEALNADWATELAAAGPDFQRLAEHVSSQFARNQNTITVLPRCAAAIATVPRAVAAHPDVCVVWFDAHADLNTPESSTTGYLGGLALSGPAGLWESGFGGNLSLANIVLVGSRDIDPFELELITSGKVRLIRSGSSDLAEEIVQVIGKRRVYVHLDCDVLHPGIVPTDFQVPGGLSLADLATACSTLARLRPVGLEIAEFQYSYEANLVSCPVSFWH
ncbi:MAG: arginase family protein [Aquincola sp.]|nr:arginase family protein [Aquincola sp.]